MNEQLPERHLYQPSEQYRANVNVLLSRMAVSPQGLQPDSVELPTTVTHRAWEKNDAIFSITFFDTAQLLTLPKDEEGDRVTLMRMNAGEDGLYEVRSYLYYRDTGDLQVANWLFTSDEVEKLEFQSPEGKRRREGIAEGFERRIYTASEVEYLDFLTDIDGHEQTLLS